MYICHCKHEFPQILIEKLNHITFTYCNVMANSVSSPVESDNLELRAKEIPPFMKVYLFEQKLKREKRQQREEEMYSSMLLFVTILFGIMLLVMCLSSLLGGSSSF